MKLIKLGSTRLKIFHILKQDFGFDPELNTVIYYHKKLLNNEITLEEFPEILDRKNSPKYEKKRNEFDINYFEKKIFSQNGEDGIIEFIFSNIGTSNKFFVEFGVQDGTECNTRYLLEKKGWTGLMMDKNFDGSSKIKKEFITAENINFLLKKYHVPLDFDLLSIDIDYNDYWVWKALEEYRPRVVIIEYNSCIPHNESRVVEYDPAGRWDKTNYFGASLMALVKLGKKKGYDLVGCDNNGINAFFIKNPIAKDLIHKTYFQMFRPPHYGLIVNGRHIGYPPSKKNMIEI